MRTTLINKIFRRVTSLLLAVIMVGGAADIARASGAIPVKEKAEETQVDSHGRAFKGEGDIGFDLNFDKWYALATLVFRFLMIFFMLLLLQVLLQASGRVIPWLENRKAPKAFEATGGGELKKVSATVESAEIGPEESAAVALALYQHLDEASGAAAFNMAEQSANPGSWNSAGRMTQVTQNQRFAAVRWAPRPKKRGR